MQALRSVDEITVDWLRVALGRPVLGWEATTQGSAWSQQVLLRVQVVGEASPVALRLKLGDATVFGASEVDYYARDYVDHPDVPLVRCFDAAADASRYHLLLDDLSATHANRWETEPTGEYGLTLADALARLHAPHWGRVPDDGALGRYLDTIRPGLEPLLAASGWGEEEREALRQAFARNEAALWARATDPAGMTLIHGDPNPGNILAPREGESPLYLIDRQPFDWSLTSWLGAYDLAYAIPLWWPAALRAAHEEGIVRRWHEVLCQRGVENYPWERAWDDYQLCAAQCLHVPIEWCRNPDDIERMRWVWEPQLVRLWPLRKELS